MSSSNSNNIKKTLNPNRPLVLPPPLPARPPVPPPRDAVTDRPTFWVVILSGIIYTRENMGNV
ncbi:hypothetical protein Tco_0278851, partial [Tanacetum coccineum]